MALVIEIREKELFFTHARPKPGGRVEVLDHFVVKISGVDIDDDFDFSNEKFNSVIINELERRNINERYASIVLNNKMAISKELDIPKMDKKRMINIAKNELKMMLNLSPDYVVDFMRLDSYEKGETTFERVMAAAVKYEDIKKIEAWTLGFNIKIKSIQTGPSAILALLGERSVITSEEAVLFGDFCDHYTRFYLYMDKKFVVMRTIYREELNTVESTKRIENLIKLMSTELYEKTGKEISKLVMMGKAKQIKQLKDDFEKNIHAPVEYFNYEKLIDGADDKVLMFMNGIGSLV